MVRYNRAAEKSLLVWKATAEKFLRGMELLNLFIYFVVNCHHFYDSAFKDETIESALN